jgi:hypothetical protein
LTSLHPQPTRSEGDVHAALARSEALLSAHLGWVERRYGAAALGVVDLPPLPESRVDSIALAPVPPLFWAREVEATGLLEVTEALADAVARGAMALPIGDAATRLTRYWRRRTNRLTAAERRAIYSHLFGGQGHPDPNAEFPTLFGEVVTALVTIVQLPTDAPTVQYLVRATEAARQLCDGFASRSVGIVPFAARDIVAHVRLALRLLGDPELARGLGAVNGPWAVVRLLAPQLIGRSTSPSSHLPRAGAGLRLLEWIVAAGTAPGGTVAVDANVTHDAATWRATVDEE